MRYAILPKDSMWNNVCLNEIELFWIKILKRSIEMYKISPNKLNETPVLCCQKQ